MSSRSGNPAARAACTRTSRSICSTGVHTAGARTRRSGAGDSTPAGRHFRRAYTTHSQRPRNRHAQKRACHELSACAPNGPFPVPTPQHADEIPMDPDFRSASPPRQKAQQREHVAACALRRPSPSPTRSTCCPQTRVAVNGLACGVCAVEPDDEVDAPQSLVESESPLVRDLVGGDGAWADDQQQAIASGCGGLDFGGESVLARRHRDPVEPDVEPGGLQAVIKAPDERLVRPSGRKKGRFGRASRKEMMSFT